MADELETTVQEQTAEPTVETAPAEVPEEAHSETPKEPEVTKEVAPSELSERELLSKILEKMDQNRKYQRRHLRILRICLLVLILIAGSFIYGGFKLLPLVTDLLNQATTTIRTLDINNINTLVSDTTGLIENTNGFVADASKTVQGIGETVENINSVDFEKLNEAIGGLSEATKNLERATAFFKLLG